MAENEKATHISAEEFDTIQADHPSWASKYKQTLQRLKVGEAVIVPCIPSCSWRKQCSAGSQVGLILGSGNYKTKHLAKRGTPDNHIAVMKLHEENE